MVIIGITGAIGVGKSTVADYIVKTRNFKEYAFAKPLKQMAIAFGFTNEQIYGTQEQKMSINSFWKISGREFMQKFGSEMMRDTLPKVMPNLDLNGLTVWVRLFELFLQQNDSDVVVSDVRFADEYNVIKAHKGYIIKIIKPDVITDSSIAKHQSETQTIDADIIIVNDSTLEELYKKIDNMIKFIENSK